MVNKTFNTGTFYRNVTLLIYIYLLYQWSHRHKSTRQGCTQVKCSYKRWRLPSGTETSWLDCLFSVLIQCITVWIRTFSWYYNHHRSKKTSLSPASFSCAWWYYTQPKLKQHKLSAFHQLSPASFFFVSKENNLSFLKLMQYKKTLLQWLAAEFWFNCSFCWMQLPYDILYFHQDVWYDKAEFTIDLRDFYFLSKMNWETMEIIFEPILCLQEHKC